MIAFLIYLETAAADGELGVAGGDAAAAGVQKINQINYGFLLPAAAAAAGGGGGTGGAAAAEYFVVCCVIGFNVF